MQSRTIQFNGLKVIFQDYFRRFTLGTTLLYMESQGLSQKYAGMLQILQFKVDVVFKYPFPQTKSYGACLHACSFCGVPYSITTGSVLMIWICRSLGATVLIDDNPRYALECAEVGIRVLLFDFENSYPWCKTDSVDLHPLVTKVHNWEAVEKQLMAWVTL